MRHLHICTRLSQLKCVRTQRSLFASNAETQRRLLRLSAGSTKNSFNDLVALQPVSTTYCRNGLDKIEHELSSASPANIPTELTGTLFATLMLHFRPLCQQLLCGSIVCKCGSVSGTVHNDPVTGLCSPRGLGSYRQFHRIDRTAPR